jgi:hypothetical protein
MGDKKTGIKQKALSKDTLNITDKMNSDPISPLVAIAKIIGHYTFYAEVHNIEGIINLV